MTNRSKVNEAQEKKSKSLFRIKKRSKHFRERSQSLTHADSFDGELSRDEFRKLVVARELLGSGRSQEQSQQTQKPSPRVKENATVGLARSFLDERGSGVSRKAMEDYVNEEMRQRFQSKQKNCGSEESQVSALHSTDEQSSRKDVVLQYEVPQHLRARERELHEGSEIPLGIEEVELK